MAERDPGSDGFQNDLRGRRGGVPLDLSGPEDDRCQASPLGLDQGDPELV